MTLLVRGHTKLYSILLTLILLSIYHHFCAPTNLSIEESFIGGLPPLVEDQLKAHLLRNIQSFSRHPPSSFPVGTFGAHRGTLVKLFPSVRMDGFKLEGGEWFKEGFRKLLSQE